MSRQHGPENSFCSPSHLADSLSLKFWIRDSRLERIIWEVGALILPVSGDVPKPAEFFRSLALTVTYYSSWKLTDFCLAHVLNFT